MKKINVFDTYKNIKDSEKYGDFTEEMLEALDDLLDQFGIDHAFSFCRNEDLEADPNNSITVMHNSNDDTKFFMVYSLFCMKYRNVETEKIEDCMKKHVAALRCHTYERGTSLMK